MENWKPVCGYEGFYEVSDMGRVRSVERIVNSSSRNGGYRVRPSRILKMNKKRNGYLTVDLCREGSVKTTLVHRIVADAFLGTEKFLQVNHINAIKTDNRVSNLEWCSAAENIAHSRCLTPYNNGLRKKIICEETGATFESSYQAAEWVNATEKQYSGNVPSMARKIRACATGAQLTAYGFHWKDAVE